MDHFGLTQGAQRFSFWARSDRKGGILVEVFEEGGEGFFDVVPLDTYWKRFEFSLSKLKPDPEKRQDGRLEANRIARLLIAYASAVEAEARGERTLWFSNWVFE